MIQDENRRPLIQSSKNSSFEESRKQNGLNNSRLEQTNGATNQFYNVQYPKQDEIRKPSVSSYNSSRQDRVNGETGQFDNVQYPKQDEVKILNSLNISRQEQLYRPNNQSAIYSVPKKLSTYGNERPPNFVRTDENDSVFEDGFIPPPVSKKYGNYTQTPPITESDGDGDTYQRVNNFSELRRQQQKKHLPPRNDDHDSRI
jgi:hypothetical protein